MRLRLETRSSLSILFAAEGERLRYLLWGDGDGFRGFEIREREGGLLGLRLLLFLLRIVAAAGGQQGGGGQRRDGSQGGHPARGGGVTVWHGFYPCLSLGGVGQLS